MKNIILYNKYSNMSISFIFLEKKLTSFETFLLRQYLSLSLNLTIKCKYKLLETGELQKLYNEFYLT